MLKFILMSAKGLVVPVNTCILLDGSITAGPTSVQEIEHSSSHHRSQLVLLGQGGFVAFIGGVLDCKGFVDHGVSSLGPKCQSGSGAPVKNIQNMHMVILHDVTISNARTDAIYMKGRLSSVPLIIHKCTVQESGRRGIWGHVSSNVYIIKNSSSGNAKDGVDLDAGCKGIVCIKNICHHNERHGIFIEEGASGNLVLGNMSLQNRQAGIHLWNEAVMGVTNSNLCAFNTCAQNNKGISVGGRGEDRTAAGNCFFNNACVHNDQEGICTGNKFSNSNSFVHTIIKDNCKKNRGMNQVNHYGPHESIQFSTPASID